MKDVTTGADPGFLIRGGGAQYVTDTGRARSASPIGVGPGPALGPWKLWVSRSFLVQSTQYLATFTVEFKGKKFVDFG